MIIFDHLIRIGHIFTREIMLRLHIAFFPAVLLVCDSHFRTRIHVWKRRIIIIQVFAYQQFSGLRYQHCFIRIGKYIIIRSLMRIRHRGRGNHLYISLSNQCCLLRLSTIYRCSLFIRFRNHRDRWFVSIICLYCIIGKPDTVNIRISDICFLFLNSVIHGIIIVFCDSL